MKARESHPFQILYIYIVIFHCWFSRESTVSSITTGHMFVLSRGLEQMEVSLGGSKDDEHGVP